MLTNSELVKTFPFKRRNVSRRLKAKILKRTKQRRVWFSKAEELDKERGTQLGTLGHLPDEIRQMIIERFFDSEIHEKMFFRGYQRSVVEERDLKRPIDQRMTCLEDLFRGRYQPLNSFRLTSASIKDDVDYYLLTKTHFELASCRALTEFLGRLTTYQKNLLRSVTIWLHVYRWEDLIDEDCIDEDCMEWMNVFAQLPPGLTAIKFRCVNRRNRCTFKEFQTRRKFPHQTQRNLLVCLELLGKQIKRCWAPRARIGMDCPYCPDGCWYRGWKRISVFDEVEDWSENWLECWRPGARNRLNSGQAIRTMSRLGGSLPRVRVVLSFRIGLVHRFVTIWPCLKGS